MIENQDKRIQELTDYYSKKLDDWAEEVIKKLTREKEEISKELTVFQIKEQLHTEKIESPSDENGVEDSILPNIKISNKRFLSMRKMNYKEKMKFYADKNKIKRIHRYRSANKLACKFFSYYNDEVNTDGQYANNGGERKVWYTKKRHYKLDYISDKDKVIVEWNEDGHYDQNGVIQKRDLIRKGWILLFYPDYSYIIVKESGHFPSGRRVKSGVQTRIFKEILVEIGKKTKKILKKIKKF